MEIKTEFLQNLDLSLPWDVGVDGNICKLAFLCYIFPENIRFEIKTVWRTPDYNNASLNKITFTIKKTCK